MSSDPLAKFRTGAATPAISAPAGTAAPSPPEPRSAPPEGREYLAFDAQDKPRWLRIKRPQTAATRSPDYAFLQDVVFDDVFWESAALVYSFMIVEIHGRNLQPVIEALAARKCSWVQQHNPKLHDPVPDDGKTPVITAIVTHIPNSQREMQGDVQPGDSQGDSGARH